MTRTTTGATGEVLEETDAAHIGSALLEQRRRNGSPAMGLVMTLVVVVPEDDAEAAIEAARTAAQEHPCRILAVTLGQRRGTPSIRAEVRAGGDTAGELALIQLSGEVVRHAESVVLPLLLPDLPVVVWWPADAPDDPACDPLGALGTRRITDTAAFTRRQRQAMQAQCEAYAPGNTDLSWTRLTPWRALLAAALDQFDAKVTEVVVEGERVSPSADLLAAWLGSRLRARVTRRTSDGPGITGVTLGTKKGDITLTRPDGRLATLSVPGQPDRPVALRRRNLPELLAEELRRLDPDDIYADTVKAFLKAGRPGRAGSGARPRGGSRSGSGTRRSSRGGSR